MTRTAPRTGPRRHPCQADAILNDEEQFAVRQLLRFGTTHVRGRRIRAPSHQRLAAPVIRMTGGAMVRPVRTGLGQNRVYWARGWLFSRRLRAELPCGPA